MRHMFLSPFVRIGLVGCVHAETTSSPPSASTTEATPAPAAPASTTVIPHAVKHGLAAPLRVRLLSWQAGLEAQGSVADTETMLMPAITTHFLPFTKRTIGDSRATLAPITRPFPLPFGLSPEVVHPNKPASSAERHSEILSRVPRL
jgi:hypothetical protein